MSAPIGLVSAFLLGTLHALEPGHGKSFLAAYLIGRENLKVKGLLSLGLSMMISHFLVLAFLAYVLKTVFAEIDIENFHEVLGWAGPLVIIIFGVVLFIRFKMSKDHDHSSAIKAHHPVLVGAISGLLPCPTALAPVMLSGIEADFSNALVYIFIYVFGMCLLLLILCVIFFFAKEFTRKHLSWFHSNYNVHLLSSVLIILVGFMYLALNFFIHNSQ